jgi:adenine-specific DNA-methyltransferase
MPTLNWIGKDKVIKHHHDVQFRVLEKQYDFNSPLPIGEGSGVGSNMLIHGDNLEALKALLPYYEGKIKCIYIDPPYNTGNEGWVYNDNVNDPKIKRWLGKVVGKEAEDLTRHDKWLCMMYPRLKLLHKLLAPDGAIFVSIDDNEQASIKLLIDEIWGLGNFVAAVICVNNPKGRSDDKYIATAHETLLVYRKKETFLMGGFKADEKITIRYNKSDEFGIYREIDLRKTGDNDKREDRPNLFYYFLYNKKTKEFYPTYDENVPNEFIQIKPTRADETDGNWRWGLKTSTENIHLLLPTFMNVRKKWTVMVKDYLTEDKVVKPTSVWDFKDVNSERGTEEFIKNLGFLKSDFPNPKPVGTIERILQISTNKNDIILDSFAGSGTTAHAVLNLNKADGGNRKFILIEMEDYAESITAERIKRVINGYADKEATGGDFAYYELGEAFFDENRNLNENLSTSQIEEYIWYSETKSPLPPRGRTVRNQPFFLEKYQETAYFFIYEKDKLTTLDYDFLGTVQIKAEQYVMYADNCTLPPEFCRAKNIIFKKIPRDISRL